MAILGPLLMRSMPLTNIFCYLFVTALQPGLLPQYVNLRANGNSFYMGERVR